MMRLIFEVEIETDDPAPVTQETLEQLTDVVAGLIDQGRDEKRLPPGCSYDVRGRRAL